MDSTATNRGLILLILLLVSTCYQSVTHAEIYKTVDREGRVTYSDRKDDGATKIELKTPNTIKPLEAPKPAKPTEVKTQSTPPLYNTLDITTPGNDSIISNGLVPFEVSFTLEPELQAEHEVQLHIDGIHYSSGGNGAITVQNIARGKHRLQLSIVDAEGKSLRKSQAISIFAYRPSAR